MPSHHEQITRDNEEMEEKGKQLRWRQTRRRMKRRRRERRTKGKKAPERVEQEEEGTAQRHLEKRTVRDTAPTL